MITERIDAITKIPPEYLHAKLPAPKSVKIEISPRCNLRCSFCALKNRESQPKHDMDFALFQRITREMREAGVEEIGLFYLGESFMNPRLLVDCIRHLKQEIKMPYVFLTSNGSLASRAHVLECMKAGLDSLKWSVNAADPDQYAHVMGVSPKNFNKALENIQDAWDIRRKFGLKTGLYASSIQYDGEQQKKMEALLKDKVLPYVDQHYWLPLYGEMTRWTEERIAELGYRPTAGNQGRIGALRQPLPCWAAFTEGHVRADGGLSACCFDSDGKFHMGDLTKQTFMEAWNSAAYQALRSAHLAGDVTGTVCQGCLAYGESDTKHITIHKQT